MFFKKSAIILCVVFVFGDAAFVDTLGKCAKNDGDCHKNQLQQALIEGGKSGIPEANIPQFDPLILKDVHLPLPNIADLHMDDGVIKGLRKCNVNDFKISIEKGHASIDMTCDLTIKGKYRASAKSPLIQSIFGSDSVHGDGNAKVKIEKLHLKFTLSFAVVEVNGDTYLKEKEKPKVHFDVLGKVVFAADNLFVGNEDASTRIVNLLNQNWKVVMGTVGNNFMKRAVTNLSELLTKFFGNIPTKDFIIDDLSSYVK